MLQGKNLNLIVAISENNVIGTREGKIPWQGLVPSDIARFVELTSKPGSNSVVMGRTTWETIPGKFRPLSHRQNIVVSRNKTFFPDRDQVVVAHSLEEAVEKANCQTLWILGGEQVYTEVLSRDLVDEMHITKVHGRFIGEVEFPRVNSGHWVLTRDTLSNTLPDRICTSYQVYYRKQ